MTALALLAALALAGDADRDDPRARIEARDQLVEERVSMEARWSVLQEARKERVRRQQRGLERVPGRAWINVGPTDEVFGNNGVRYKRVDSGRGRQLVLHPTDPNTMYLATAGGGVWKTRDGAKSWQPITETLGSLAVGSLALDPEAPDIIYLGFGDPFDEQWPGIVVSRDGGGTWSDPVALKATYNGQAFLSGSVRALQVDPQDSAHVLAGTDVGLFESHDAGLTFSQVVLPADAKVVPTVWSIAWAGGSTFLVSGQLLTDQTTILGANRSGHDGVAPLGLWRTEDAGHTWTSVRDGLLGGAADHISRATLAAAAGTLLEPATSRLYLLSASRVDDLADVRQRDVYRSEDGGRTWVPLNANALGAPINPNDRQKNLDVMGPQAWYNQAIAVDPVDPDIVYIGGQETSARSIDGGANWSVMSEGYAVYQVPLASVHPDFHSMVVSAIPGQPRALYAVTDGGLYRSTDAHSADFGSITFSDSLNKGLATHLVYDLACADESWPPTLQGFLIGGTQDNGTRLREGISSTFDEVLGGDGVGVGVTRKLTTSGAGTLPAYVLASIGSGGGRIGISRDGGKGYQEFTAGLGGDPPFLVRFARDADGLRFLTYTTPPDGRAYVTSGDVWSALSVNVNGKSGFVTSEGKASAFHSIGTHPKLSGVWGMTGDAGTVYFTHDAGATWTMAPAVLGFNAVAGQGLKGTSGIAFPPDYDPVRPATQTIYASSLASVLYDGTTPIPPGFGHAFKTTDGGKSWQPLLGTPGHALPEVPVQRIRVDPDDAQTIYAATDVGLYRSIDGGTSFDPMGVGLPLTRVCELCFSGGALYAATYGRGFWQLDTLSTGNPSGVRGNGDTNHDGRIDGLDVMDVAAALGATQADPRYRLEADVVGEVNKIDDDDLAAVLAKLGGAP